MWLTKWWRSIWHRAYDHQGNLKYLLGRENDPSQLAFEGISSAVRDKALSLVCESFGIHPRQRYCLRGDDKLIAIYRSFEPRMCDQFEFERLGLAMDSLPGKKISAQEVLDLRTVEDLVRRVAARYAVD